MRAPDDEHRLWRVRKTDEFNEAWEQAKRQLSRPTDHMVAFERGLARQPMKLSYPFIDDDQRILRTVDPADGKEIWVYFRVHRDQRCCELGWVHVRDIPDEAEP